MFNSDMRKLYRRFLALGVLLGAMAFFVFAPATHADFACDVDCFNDRSECRDLCDLEYGHFAPFPDPDGNTECKLGCSNNYNACEYNCAVQDGTPCYVCDNQLNGCLNGCTTAYNNCYDACAPEDTTCQNNCATTQDSCNGNCQTGWYNCQYGCTY